VSVVTPPAMRLICMTLRTKGDATGNELTESRWQKKKPMNTTNITGDLGGESSEIRLADEQERLAAEYREEFVKRTAATTDTEAYMQKQGWSQMGRIDVRSMWRVAADVIDEMENNKDCAFTWSNDRKAIIVWRNEKGQL